MRSSALENIASVCLPAVGGNRYKTYQEELACDISLHVLNDTSGQITYVNPSGNTAYRIITSTKAFA
ncbi:MAG: hypothetical protein AAGG59_03325 [Bacteroidota bacterium]